VEVDVAPDGTVRHFAILQAPDEAIVKSLSYSISRFRAAPEADKSVVRRSKLFFYFVLSPRKAEVFVVNDPVQKAKLVQLRQDLGDRWLK